MENSIEKRSMAQNLVLTLKGIAMGAADVIPGVSGGTIAFITGIYEELIEGINSINLKNLKLIRTEGFASFWKAVHGTFFVFLFLGIGLSLLTLSHVVTYLLTNYEVLVWSFFFGLVLASAWLVGKTIDKWNWKIILALIIGTAIAFYISTLQTATKVDGKLYLFLCGAIAICAMILPGISGSFILVLLGAYSTILEAAKTIDIGVLSVFMLGCIVGILSFAKLLKYLFKNFKDLTIAILTGFLIGSLYKIWPWKNIVGDTPLYQDDKKTEWMKENVLPQEYLGENYLWFALLLMCAGILVIILLDKFSPKKI